MSARVLVVDDNPLNVKLLAAKLARDYYSVTTAENGAQALKICETEQPDLVLLDVMMPEIDGFEVCKRLKADPATRHIPVVMVTALSDTSDRVRGLEAGADDFLTKPINDVALMARVRSLLRLKMIMDEWRLREATAAQFDFPSITDDKSLLEDGHILLLEDNPNDRKTVEGILQSINVNFTTCESVAVALQEADTGKYDLVILSLDLEGQDGLMLCAQLRAREHTRTQPILMMANEGEIDRVAKGLDLGANDYLLRPLEGSEMIARTRTQLQQKRHYDWLRKNYEQSLALALVDPMTGAYNRRYLDTHLAKMFARYRTNGRQMSVLYIDIDFFKRVNDTHGHPVGDAVIKEVVNRVIQNLRPLDLVVRLGGEEFAVIMPEIELKTALLVGERLREAIAGKPFDVLAEDKGLSMTISLGVASVRAEGDDRPEKVLGRADKALLQAKQTGRNKVVSETAVDDKNEQTD